MAEVAIIAGRPQDTVGSSVGNAGVRLAQSLAGAADEVSPVLQGLAKSAQEKQAAKAHADALSTQGQALADAVRAGKLEKTQNPYYMQAYERAAAGVRGRAEVSTLLEESQTWQSRSDPAAYQKEFAGRLGEIEQKYAGTPDGSVGFRAVAEPLAAQGIQQNIQYNVARINEEHVQNVSTMATTNIQAVSVAHAGKPSPAQVFAAIEPQHQSWLSTGGTESDWNQLVINSVVGAAFNTSNSSLLNALDDPRGGKGALSAIAGPDGKPVAQDLATARYRIESAEDQASTREIRQRLNVVKLEGGKAVQDVWSTFGADFLNGAKSRDDVVQDLLAKGYSPQAISFAIGDLGKSAADNQAFTRATMGANPEVLDVSVEARTQGITPNVLSKVSNWVRTGQMTVDEAQQIISQGQSRSDHLESEARADARAAKSDARAAATQERVLTLQTAKSLKTSREQVSADVAVRLSAAGIRSLTSPKARNLFDQTLEDAEGAHLLAHPGDALGAQQAVRAAAASYVRNQNARRVTKPATTQPRGSGNPRS